MGSQSASTSVRRTDSVERCLCPPGYEGLSCQGCSFGHTRVNGTLFRGECRRCECNGHAQTCHPVTMECSVSQNTTRVSQPASNSSCCLSRAASTTRQARAASAAGRDSMATRSWAHPRTVGRVGAPWTCHPTTSAPPARGRPPQGEASTNSLWLRTTTSAPTVPGDTQGLIAKGTVVVGIHVFHKHVHMYKQCLYSKCLRYILYIVKVIIIGIV